MTETPACGLDDLRPGSARRIDVTPPGGDSIGIALIRDDDGRYFAIDDTCTHGAVSLSEGEILGSEVECWGHGGRFDLRTGEATHLPAIEAVRTYPVRLSGEQVFVDIDTPTTSDKETS